MIDHITAKKKAEKEMPDLRVESCFDIGDRYAFSFCTASGDIPPGTPFVCIDKQGGEVSFLPIPPLDNLDIIEAGTEIEL